MPEFCRTLSEYEGLDDKDYHSEDCNQEYQYNDRL